MLTRKESLLTMGTKQLVASNIQEFSQLSNYQQTIISLLSGLTIQKE
jgi:hypothetical protein